MKRLAALLLTSCALPLLGGEDVRDCERVVAAVDAYVTRCGEGHVNPRLDCSVVSERSSGAERDVAACEAFLKTAPCDLIDGNPVPPCDITWNRWFWTKL